MVFVTKNNKIEKKDLTVANITGRKTKKGHIGIEIEVESSVAGSLPREGLGKFWYYEHDGSLRGRDNGEYILTKPIDFDDVSGALDELWAVFKAKGAKLIDSNRTSVHVHLNVLPFFQNRLVALIALWYIFEEPLIHWCGDDRVGNLFCLRGKDGPAILTQIREYVESRGTMQLPEGTHHYASLNVSQIWQHGSIEIRTMRGVLKPEPIKQWVGMMKKLYEKSEKYTDPRSIIETFSLDGPMDFFRNTFGDDAEAIYKESGMTDDEFRASLYEGVRYAQELAYARDWTDFKPEVVTEDPFGRKAKKEAPPPEPAQGERLHWEPEGDLEEIFAERTVRGRPRTIFAGNTGRTVRLNTGQATRILEEAAVNRRTAEVQEAQARANWNELIARDDPFIRNPFNIRDPRDAD